MALQSRGKAIVLASPARRLGAADAAPGQAPLRSLQASVALLDLQPAPTWQVYVDDTRVVGGGRKVPMRWKVTEHDPAGRRSAFETIESKMIKPSGVISVAQAGEGSEVTFEFTTNPFGFGWLMAPLINRDVTKTVTENLGRLKENLERS